MKISDSDIIKAFDVLKSWQKLAYHNDDGTDEDSHELYIALTIIFEYINRQKEENESLERRLQNAQLYQEELYKQLQDERLLRFSERFIKTEGINEFANKLDETKIKIGDDYFVYADNISVIKKEMEGDNDV